MRLPSGPQGYDLTLNEGQIFCDGLHSPVPITIPVGTFSSVLTPTCPTFCLLGEGGGHASVLGGEWCWPGITERQGSPLSYGLCPAVSMCALFSGPPGVAAHRLSPALGQMGSDSASDLQNSKAAYRPRSSATAASPISEGHHRPIASIETVQTQQSCRPVRGGWGELLQGPKWL